MQDKIKTRREIDLLTNWFLQNNGDQTKYVFK